MLGKDSFSNYIGNIFTRASSTYDEEDPKFFSYFGRKLVNFSPLSHDMNVLDIGTGRGAVFYPILEELSHMGSLIGIDIAEGMVDQVNTELNAYRIQNAVVINLSADNLEFHDEFFDLITCGLSIYFFENLDKVFREIKRVLKSTGYFTFSTWLRDESRQFNWYNDILKKYIPTTNKESKGGNKTPKSNDYDFTSVEGIERMVKDNQFKIIKMSSGFTTFTYLNAQSFWNKIWSYGERVNLEKIPESKKEEFK